MAEQIPRESVTTDPETGALLMRVANGTEAKAAASAIANFVREKKKITLLAMGAGAVNQGFKACAICRGLLAPEGLLLSIIPAFGDEFVDGKQKTIMRFILSVQQG